MSKIKVLCTDKQKKQFEQVLKVGYVSTIACEIAHGISLSPLYLNDFEFIILKDGEARCD